ncbi:MAG: hypothetical protein D6702_01275 [Planctomycetota bacterium]|nr:MAG: hypothetical protein D6702_01275 [Planctomycetota bacterium]
MKSLSLSLSLWVGILAAAPLSAQATYTAHSMDWQGTPVANHTRAVAVTDTGFVLCEGIDSTNGHTFVYWSRLRPSNPNNWDQARAPHPGYEESYAGGIAITGTGATITGWLRPTAGQLGQDEGFFWPVDPANPTVPVTAFKVDGNAVSQPKGINRDGLMVGRTRTIPNSLYWKGFRRSIDLNEPNQELPPLDSSFSRSWAWGINGAGYTVGASDTTIGPHKTQATAWLPSSTARRGLDWLDPALPEAEAKAVNRGLYAVGWSGASVPGASLSMVKKAVIWTSPTPQALTDLSGGTILASQGDAAQAISAGIPGVLEEEVVGEYWDASQPNPQKLGFVWSQTGGFQDLRSLVVSGLPVNELIVEAKGINSLGEIAATAQDILGHRYAVLLTPNVSTPRLGRVNAPLAGAQTVICGIGFAPNTTANLYADDQTGSFTTTLCGQTVITSVDTSPSQNLVASVSSDANGRVIFIGSVPQLSFGTKVFFQAMDCLISNVVEEVIQ